MSEFDLFPKELVQNNVDRSSYNEYSPLAAITPGAAVEFAIPGSDLIALDLTKSFIYLRTKITKADDGAPANTVNVGPVNNTLHSAFSNLDIEVGGRLISDPNGLYPYRAFFETVFSHDQDVQESRLQAQMWFKDTAGKMTTFKTLDAAAENAGLKSRAAFYSAGAEVELLGRLHGDIFHQNRCLPSNLPLKIRLTPAKNKFVLVSGDDVDANHPQVEYKFAIVDARLFVHTFELTKALAMAQEEAMAHDNLRYPIHRVTMKHLSIPRGQTSALHDNIYLGQLPDRIVMGFVTDAAMAGGYQQNPFNFQHFGVNYLALTVNGEQFPGKPFQPDYDNKKYIREYMSMFDGMGYLFGNKAIAISRTDYALGYTLYVFDLTADHAASNSASPPKTGSIRLEVKFAAATTETINAVLYAEFRSRIEIDKYRNVIVPF